MDLEAILSEPSLRRCWLLNRALENAPFEDALKLAKAAAEFLDGGQGDFQFRPGMGNKVPVAAARSAETKELARFGLAISPTSAGVISPETEGEEGEQCAQSTGSASKRGAALGFREVATSKEPGLSTTGPEDAGEARDAEKTAAAPRATGTEIDLAVLASVDEVVRYLRQRDDTVVSDGPAAFLVNGRFRLNQVELFARANKMRQRQGKPEFQLVPLSFTAPNDRGVPRGPAS